MFLTVVDKHQPQQTTHRILLCGPSRYAVSGVATHLNQLLESSLAKLYILQHFQVGSEGRNESVAKKILRYLKSPFLLAVSIARFRPDIVHLNSSLDQKSYWRDLVYLIVAKVFRCRVVYQVHGGELPAKFLGRSKLAQFFLRWSLGLPDVVVLLAEVERKEYLEFDAGKRICVIPNAINLDEYKLVVPKTFTNNLVRLGYIGRLAADKGIREVIEAMVLLLDDGIANIHLTIAGSGPYEDELRALVNNSGIGNLVAFVGPIFHEEKLEFWNNIDIFVFPTYHNEGLPYTVLESLASGTPQITTRVGGIADVITDGVQGLLIEPHSSVLAANAIKELLDDGERFHNMSVAAIKRAHENYSVERLATQFDNLYNELLV
jgi:glycosyltransferase involved in cell wall biosynthesis